MIKAVLFDWDDVFIVGSKEGYFDCYHKTLIKLGVRLSREEEIRRILKNWGKHPKIELKGLLKEYPEKVDEAYRIYEEILLKSNTFIKHVRPIKGINITLLKLSKRYKLGVATGMNPKLLEKVMEKFRIPNVFSKIISAYDIKDEDKQKPSPYMLNQLLKYFRITKDEAIYVGDSESDVLMAKNAGITPVVVLTGHLSKEEAKKMGVKFIIKDVTKIEKVLKELN